MTATLQRTVLTVWEGSCVCVSQGMKEMEPFVKVSMTCSLIISAFLGIFVRCAMLNHCCDSNRSLQPIYHFTRCE